MGLFRNLFICCCLLTVFAIFTHGLAIGLPYWVYRTVNVKMNAQYVDVLAYEGIFKTCIEYDDVVHVKNCTMYSGIKDWITVEQYLVSFSMAGLVVAFGADVLVAMGIFRSKSYAICSNALSVIILFGVLILYGIKSESDAYYVSFGCEIVSLVMCSISSFLRLIICRGELHGPYENIY